VSEAGSWLLRSRCGTRVRIPALEIRYIAQYRELHENALVKESEDGVYCHSPSWAGFIALHALADAEIETSIQNTAMGERRTCPMSGDPVVAYIDQAGGTS